MHSTAEEGASQEDQNVPRSGAKKNELCLQYCWRPSSLDQRLVRLQLAELGSV